MKQRWLKRGETKVSKQRLFPPSPGSHNNARTLVRDRNQNHFSSVSVKARLRLHAEFFNHADRRLIRRLHRSDDALESEHLEATPRSQRPLRGLCVELGVLRVSKKRSPDRTHPTSVWGARNCCRTRLNGLFVADSRLLRCLILSRTRFA